MKKYIPFFLLLLLAVGILSKAAMGLDLGHQHDFISYYYGAKAMIMGLNGYDAQVVSASQVKAINPTCASYIPHKWHGYLPL